ncbi:unnamed protein product [Pleuronectes platessa]|uniref:Uncharacterized protein n=1 Tax=Pleuronectes platessa TaxID=8262 RepID=A0A9N7YXT5_PLEPL|nr:unnamed protein product [Pleuronectes platessa]
MTVIIVSVPLTVTEPLWVLSSPGFTYTVCCCCCRVLICMTVCDTRLRRLQSLASNCHTTLTTVKSERRLSEELPVNTSNIREPSGTVFSCLSVCELEVDAALALTTDKHESVALVGSSSSSGRQLNNSGVQ